MSAPARFEVKQLAWEPYLAPVELTEASDAQLAAMQVTPSNGKVSAYVRTLAHDPDSYVARTRLFNAIMYAKGGLDRADRELGALVASAVNQCRYCGSIHGRRFVELSGRWDVVETIYRKGLSGEFDQRTKAIVCFAEALSQSPPTLRAEHVDALTQNGFSKGEVLDLVHAVAIFGWANRLMHTLGHATPLKK